jgi:CRP-like cAMP-binding protein
MFIDTDILIAWGGISKRYKKGEYIFHEDEVPRCFYQIIDGTVKLYNTNFDGKEYTQAEFKKGNSFGEPPLFIDELYPATAVTTEESVIIRLSKERFLEILDEYPEIQKKLICTLARRIYNKSITAREIINNSPELRILAFLNEYKKKNLLENEKIEIPYTRQEIANFTGLRVETVIRTLSKMKALKTVDIVDRKLIY